LENDAKKRHYEVERRVNPRTCADFSLLYNELDHWRANELAKINRDYPLMMVPPVSSEEDTGEEDATAQERRRLLNEVLAKETKALQTIDRLKVQAAKEGRARRVEKELDLMSAPKR
jgi:hypothetical protein